MPLGKIDVNDVAAILIFRLAEISAAIEGLIRACRLRHFKKTI